MAEAQHPLDKWFATKPRVQRAGISAIVIDDAYLDWEEFLIGHRHWRPEDVVLVRCLLQPTDEEIEEFLTEMVFHDDELALALLEAWRQPMSKCWENSQLRSFKRKTIFSFTCYLERGMPGMSGYWGYCATHFYGEWAMLCEFGDEGPFINCTPPSPFDERPLGFIDVSCPFRSAALLLSERTEVADAHNGFSGDHYGWATSIAGKVDSTEIYRLLLARDGLGSDEVISMTAPQLKHYRPSGNCCGYEAIERIRG
jgi:hypothetical protein